MALGTEVDLIAELQRVRDAGGEFLNTLYVHRSIQRAFPDTSQDSDAYAALDAMLAIMETALGPLFRIESIREGLLQTFRLSVDFLARMDGLTSSDLRAALIQTLGLVHLLDGVKENKVSVQRDFALYEETLRRRLGESISGGCGNEVMTDKSAELQERLEKCRTLRKVFSSPKWFMNGLLAVLTSVTKVAGIMADLIGLLAKGLSGEEDGSGPVFLPHDRYKLLRALPIALYLYHFLSKKTVVVEPISSRVMDACFRLLKRYPVVPGVGDYAVLLYVPILGIVFMPGGSYPKDMKRYSVMSLDELDRKYLEHLEREYSLANTHEVMGPGWQFWGKEWCVESKNWREAGEALPLTMCQEAVNLSFRTLKHLSEWRCHIHELLAWRKSAPTLHETFQIIEDNGYTRITSRVIRIFQDSEVPLVLETLVCVDGLTKLFRKTKDEIMSSMNQWLHHVVQIFLEQTCKKRDAGSLDVHDIFNTIETLKLQILEGHLSLYRISCNVPCTSADTKFDPHDPACLVKLRKAAEELYFVCNLHPSKSKISSYFCGHPGTVAPGVNKATKDLLHQLYIMQEVMKADDHLEKISDFFDISMREREIEVTGTADLNRASTVALQLAHGAINACHGGSLEPVFTALELFDDASEKLLNVYKSQLIYMELSQTAMEGLEVVLDDICKQAIVQAKVHACVTDLDLAPAQWVEEMHGAPNRPTYNFSCIFQKESLSFAGYDVDIQAALVERVDTALKTEYCKIFSGLESTKEPTLIVPCHKRIQILEGAHRWLASQLSLSSWESYVKEKGEEGLDMTPLSTVARDSILLKLLPGFNYDMRAGRFKPFHNGSGDPFSFKLSAWPSTPKISFSDPKPKTSHRDINAAFGFEDVCQLHALMSQSEIDQMITDIKDFVAEELHLFLDESLPALFDFIPLELIDLHMSELSSKEELSSTECLSFIMEKFGTDITHTSVWLDSLRNLERIGNALIFLHLLQICLLQARVAQTLGSSTFLRDMNVMQSDGRDPGGFGMDSGNPFEMEIRKKKERTAVEKPSTRPAESRIVHSCVHAMKAIIQSREQKHSHQQCLDIKNAISAVLFLKTYAQTNAQMINVSLGDGVLWATNIITQLSEDGQFFDENDWIHEILKLTQIDETLTSFQIPNDIRSFLSHAQRIVSSWRHISQFRFCHDGDDDDNKQQQPSTTANASETRSRPLKMMTDPPMRGFFGGLNYTPSSAHRRNIPSFLSSMGHTRTPSLRTHKITLGMSLSSRSNVGSASLESSNGGHGLTASAARSFVSHDREQTPTPGLLMRRTPASSSASFLKHRHSN